MADPKHPRHYDEAFKRQIVQLYDNGKRLSELEAEYDLGHSTVARWVKSIHENGSTRAADARTPEQQRILELERENRQLRMEVVNVNINFTNFAGRQNQSRWRGDTVRAGVISPV